MLAAEQQLCVDATVIFHDTLNKNKIIRLLVKVLEISQTRNINIKLVRSLTILVNFYNWY